MGEEIPQEQVNSPEALRKERQCIRSARTVLRTDAPYPCTALDHRSVRPGGQGSFTAVIP